MFGLIVNNFMDDHRLNLGTGPYAKRSELSLDELTEVGIVVIPIASLVFITVCPWIGLWSWLPQFSRRIRFLTRCGGASWWVLDCRFLSSLLRSSCPVLQVLSWMMTDLRRIKGFPDSQTMRRARGLDGWSTRWRCVWQSVDFMYDCFGFKMFLGRKTNVRQGFVGSLWGKWKPCPSGMRCLGSHHRNSPTLAHILLGLSAESSIQVQYKIITYVLHVQLRVGPKYTGKQKVRLLSSSQ